NNGQFDHKGTCGNTVLICSATFKFEAGKQYAFFLDSGTDVWRDYDIYSTDSMNASGLGFANQFKFLQGTSVLSDLRYQQYATSPISDLATTPGIQNANPFAGPVLIAIEDSGLNGHRDFNDFLVTAQVAVPEPATLAGLGMIAGAMAMSRRRKTNHSA
ncbi:MAG: PEP-CTERM sorting domain-containing protein, partial [candidate division WOR-3 bacterium]